MNDISILSFLPILIVILFFSSMVYYARQTTKANNGQPKGIYGWLLFFVLILILSGFVGVTSSYRDLSEVTSTYPELLQYPEFQLFSKIVLSTVWSQAFICLYLVFILKTKKIAGTIKTVIMGLWILGIGANIIMSILLILLVPDMFVPSARTVVELYISPIVFAAVWTLYLKKSKRVKNTYPSI